MIDLHAHLLPGVDDGPATWEEALDLSRQLAGQGVTGVLATSHFVPGRYPDTGKVLALAGELNSRLRSVDVSLTVYPGAEAYLVPELPQLVAGKTVLTLNDAGRYLLLELPFEGLPPGFENVLFTLLLKGVIPVLAHPERNAQLREDPFLLATLVERGALVQINAGSLVGEFGVQVQKYAGNLVQQGLIHFLGSDAHCPRRRPPLWSAAVHRLEKLAGREVVMAVTLKNPAALLADGEIASCGRLLIYSRGSGFWRRIKKSP